MTTFRSRFVNGDWKIRLALVSTVLGFLGFFACWTILSLGERRVFSSDIYMTQSEDRMAKIEAKGDEYYVESNYGARYNFAQIFIWYVWFFALAGGYYLNVRDNEGPKI